MTKMNKNKYFIALISIFMIFIFTISSFALSLDLKDKNEKVEEVQNMLSNLGYNITVDGIYGLGTKSIVKTFQRNNGLKVDGVVGDSTYKALKERTTDIKYKVKKGDTLYDLAKKYDTTVSDIKEKNNLNSNLIKPEDTIIIPKTGKGGGRNVNLSNKIIHEVEPGDTLSGLSKKYGVDIETIKLANNLRNSTIRIGDNLIIPYMEKNTARSFQLTKGAFIWPVMGRISSSYGSRIHPINNERSFHSGLDIAVPLNKEIRAAASGRVIQSGWISGYGKAVTIDHGNNIKTRYAHNSRLIVKKGSTVRVGDVIALSGSTGLSTGSHLHFEIRKGNNTVNPIKYLP